MSILLHYEMVVISVMPTSHLGQSRDLVSGSGGGDLETSDGDMGSGDGQDDVHGPHLWDIPRWCMVSLLVHDVHTTTRSHGGHLDYGMLYGWISWMGLCSRTSGYAILGPHIH